jgi:predicted nucleic acid-binding protein
MKVLVDTSCWTHALRRKGDEAIRARVRELLAAEQAAWCDMIRLELWNGAASDWDKLLLKDLQVNIQNLPITDDVWQRAVFLAQRA